MSFSNTNAPHLATLRNALNQDFTDLEEIQVLELLASYLQRKETTVVRGNRARAPSIIGGTWVAFHRNDDKNVAKGILGVLRLLHLAAKTTPLVFAFPKAFNSRAFSKMT
ncbi:hypothetical protein BDB00DRAFT_789032 [Zychaea mexicana]|uniref:uncharacterized protein n=1 Tax=Zychaea mexicana TaxID=64656 RepID=UPI0022FE2DBC|nr:uncharacterized protein BDB00DRAFT_789032 [Zychaea mexicana]KAI9492072.1 hypothetical protein BDB00DRAFT_789032 [Zychaea mexicana]